LLRRRLSVSLGLVFRMNQSVSRCAYIGPSTLALGLGCIRRFAVASRLTCFCGRGNAARIQQIVRLFSPSRVLQAPLKTSVGLWSIVSSSVSRLQLLDLTSLVRSIGRTVLDNARATCFDRGRFYCERVMPICAVRLFVRPFVLLHERRREAPYTVACCIYRNSPHRDPASHVQAMCTRLSVLLPSTPPSRTGSTAHQYQLYAIFTQLLSVYMYHTILFTTHALS
jgi:hypothetical protein